MNDDADFTKKTAFMRRNQPGGEMAMTGTRAAKGGNSTDQIRHARLGNRPDENAQRSGTRRGNVRGDTGR